MILKLYSMPAAAAKLGYSLDAVTPAFQPHFHDIRKEQIASF